jgi:hypothetical protein
MAILTVEIKIHREGQEATGEEGTDWGEGNEEQLRQPWTLKGLHKTDICPPPPPISFGNNQNTSIPIIGIIFLNIFHYHKPGYRSRYSDWLRAGRPRGWSSSPGRGKNFLLSTASRPALGPTHPSIQWVPGAVSLGVKRPGREADHSPRTSAQVKNTCINRLAFVAETECVSCEVRTGFLNSV